MMLSCEDTKGKVRFVLTLEELLRVGRLVAGWITRVGLRAGRSVELDYE